MQQVLNARQQNVARSAARQRPRFRAAGVGTMTQSDELWHQLCRWHTDALLTFALRLAGGDGRYAEAIVQQTLTLAWRNRDRLGPVEALRPWLLTTARRVAIGQAAVAEDVLYAADDATRDDNRARLEGALSRLAPEERAVLAEVCAGRKTISGAARSTGMSTGAAKTRVFEALEKLRWSVPQDQPVH
jgi:RNA polymerase sigma-70 factor, ECF subfamily